MKKEFKKKKKKRRREEPPPPAPKRIGNQLVRQIQDELDYLDQQDAWNEANLRDLRD